MASAGRSCGPGCLAIRQELLNRGGFDPVTRSQKTTCAANPPAFHEVYLHLSTLMGCQVVRDGVYGYELGDRDLWERARSA